MIVNRGVVLAFVVAPSVLCAQTSRIDFLKAFDPSVQNVTRSLGVKSAPKAEFFMDNLQVWTFSFRYKGADDAVAWLVGPDATSVQSWRFGLYFRKNIGEKAALRLVGLNPADWTRKSPTSYLKSKKHPKVMVKYNRAANRFISFETAPRKSGLPWGIEIAKDPYY